MTPQSELPTTTGRTGRIIRRSVVGAALATCFVGAAGGVAHAVPGSSSSDTVDAHVGVNSAISLSGLTADFTLNGLPGSSVTGPNATSYEVTTNNIAGYAVTVQSETSTMEAATSSNSDSIPIENLQVSNSNGAMTSLSDSTPVTVHTQNHRSASLGDALSDSYEVAIPFVNEDTYTATLNYVATTL